MFKLLTAGLMFVALSQLPAQSTYFIGRSVVDETGKAACGVRVCAYASDFDPKKPGVLIPCAWTDPQGHYDIVTNRAGRYTLYYEYSAHGYLSPYLPFFRNPSAPVYEVVLDDANVRASANITLMPKNGLLVGKSVDAVTGYPVESVEFILCHAEHPSVCWHISARNSDGSFRIPAPHVPFTVKVKAGGYEDWLGPEDGEQPPFSVAPNTKWIFTVTLKRSETSRERALGEAEKQPGVNLPAPTQTAPADGAVFDYYPRVTKLEWSPVEGAVSYSVEVDYCSGSFRSECVNPQPHKFPNNPNPATEGIVGNTYEFSFVGAQPGRWRVWAVDREGREGFKSPWRRFVYNQ